MDPNMGLRFYRTTLCSVVTACSLAVALIHADAAGQEIPLDHRFRTTVLSQEFHSEGAAVGDIDSDGELDIVSGPFYYRGPDFSSRVAFASVRSPNIQGYSEHFFTFPFDFNGDGLLDLLTLPIPGGDAVWFENPGSNRSPWEKHLAKRGLGSESPHFVDLTGDGQPELLGIVEGKLGLATWDPTAAERVWEFRPLSEEADALSPFTHGLGVGDVNDDGLLDVLVSQGWWQSQPGSPPKYEFHRQSFAAPGGSQMYAYDFDGDGDQDVVSVQHAHGFGLSWFERRGTGDDFLFVPHIIADADGSLDEYGLRLSQMHALALADMDGDGVQDIVTGKRYYAHGGRDPGAFELPLLVWYQTRRLPEGGVKFVPHVIHKRSGVGTQLVVRDINGDGLPDVISANKLGTFLHTNGVDSAANPQTSLAKTDRPLSRIGTDAFSVHVRESEALSAEEQCKTFELPDGFEIQLFASEPDIAKPMNLAFDARGRLWVSSSQEYPYAAKGRPARDTIKILEDTNGDGRADKITTFADNLNIPIGLYPYQDGVICFSIPNILFLRDTNGDSRADKQEILYGPMDTSRDTHGMCNGFTRGLDGWLHACHGFNNRSEIVNRDGHRVSLHSGNTFRMLPGGQRLEQFTHGQVNPFGLSFDVFGDLFSADCHTKPVSLLVPGGYYPSFGKPHDGLGFVPDVMQHLHGSTGVGGIAIYEDDKFPEAYRGDVLGGNVMTGRVNRNSLRHIGSTVQAVEEPDFLVSGDPWFRPVDIQLGPDGALYVADFYNRIIGHYEVDLDHPGRDRHRGRIWRITYSDKYHPNSSSSIPAAMDGNSHIEAEFEYAIRGLADPNLTRRMLATHALVDRFPEQAKRACADILHAGHPDEKPPQALGFRPGRVHAGWVLKRLETLTFEDLKILLDSASEIERVHAFRILAVGGFDIQHVTSAIRSGLSDESAIVQRAAATASERLALLKQGLDLQATASAVWDTLGRVPPQDVHLRHALRMSLRSHLNDRQIFASLTQDSEQWPPERRKELAEICMAIPTQWSAAFLLTEMEDLVAREDELSSAMIRFLARNVSQEQFAELVALCQAHSAKDFDSQEALIRSLREGMRPLNDTEIDEPAISHWATNIALALLGISKPEDSSTLSRVALPSRWRSVTLSSDEADQDCWSLSTKRNSADGESGSRLWSSFPGGESQTGRMRSSAFALPARLSFYLAGHDGFPDQPLQHKNFVRLRAAETREIIHQWSPPRNDVAQRMHWSSPDLVGSRAYFELVDGDSGRAYAWLAAGRFSIDSLNPSVTWENWSRANQLIRDFRLRAMQGVVLSMLGNKNLSSKAQSELLETCLILSPPHEISLARALVQSLTTLELEDELRNAITHTVLSDESGGIALLRQILARSSFRQQKSIAMAMGNDAVGVRQLMDLFDSGGITRNLFAAPELQSRLRIVARESDKGRLESLFQKAPPLEPQFAGVASLVAKLSHSPGSEPSGRLVFEKNCSGCHQVRGQGAMVGPNLDGIGGRGLSRLAEDVFLPNQNVDRAFHATTLLTEDDRVLVGLVRKNQDGTVKLVDSKGKQHILLQREIASLKTEPRSPMPSNFLEVLSEQESRDLMTYLLKLRR